MSKAVPVSIEAGFSQLKFFGHRTPGTTDDDLNDAFGDLGEYREGSVFIAHYAGDSEWERHPVGDEFVMVLEGETTLILLVDGAEKRNPLGANEFLVVPQNTWHRFETPNPVKVLALTPQPSDHSVEWPQD